MARRSAGLLLWRRAPDVQVLLAHPGGPHFARRDEDVWTVPKGEYDAAEVPLLAAYREFTEELGSPPPSGEALPLGEVVQKGGKIVTAWALEGDLDVTRVVSNTCTITWPPRSGRLLEIPEIDRAQWFDLAAARTRIKAAQQPFLDRLLEAVQRSERVDDDSGH